MRNCEAGVQARGAAGKRRRIFAGLGACLAMAAIFSCGPKKPPAEKPVVVMWGDSLSLGQARDLCAPDTMLPDSVVLLRAARIIGLCGAASPLADSAQLGMAADVAAQLTLRTGVTWPPRAAALMLSAVRNLVARAQELGDARRTAAFVDSAARSSRTVLTAPLAAVDIDTAASVALRNSRDDMAALVSRTLILGKAGALIFIDFALSESAVAGLDASAAAAAMVKDLLTSGAAAKSPSADVHRPVLSNAQALAALKLRSQQSIQDSIIKHSSDVKAIYKKALKANVSLRGQVWVTFRVAPSGEVADAAIWKSQINDPSFIDPFLTYVKSMRFLPIAEAAGEMSFNFPFEFAPE